jgi:hypothetical protein
LTRGAGDLLYYSFVTLSTVGYGDVTPASPAARSSSLIEAVVGIMYAAAMIARFISIQTNDAGRNEPANPEQGEDRFGAAQHAQRLVKILRERSLIEPFCQIEGVHRHPASSPNAGGGRR